MMRNEDAISQLVSVQNQQLRSFEIVQQNVADLRNSIASLNLATLRDDIMNSVRDVVRQEAVSQVPAPLPLELQSPQRLDLGGTSEQPHQLWRCGRRTSRSKSGCKYRREKKA